MMADRNNYAFIDTQNVFMGTRAADWTIDVFRLRRYLKEKFGVARAFWFVGYLPDRRRFYTVLQSAGFIVIFKEVGRDRDGTPKGNVDVDLTLQAVDLKAEYDQAVILTSDGDFASLVSYLRERDKLRAPIHQSSCDGRWGAPSLSAIWTMCARRSNAKCVRKNK